MLHASRLLSPEPVIAAARRVRRNSVSLLNQEWAAERSPVHRTVWRALGQNPLRLRLLADIEEHSLPGVLRVSDRNAMTFSVENRLPFLTRKLAQFAFTLPDHALVDDHGQGKALLRDAFRGLIPASVLDRRKVAFAVPLAEWLTASKAVQHSFQRAATLPFIDQPNLSRLLKLAAERRLTGTDLFSLWRVFGLVQWLEVFDVQLN
jgi:asparagine synthase (glutamine-hydrolysing)